MSQIELCVYASLASPSMQTCRPSEFEVPCSLLMFGQPSPVEHAFCLQGVTAALGLSSYTSPSGRTTPEKANHANDIKERINTCCRSCTRGFSFFERREDPGPHLTADCIRSLRSQPRYTRLRRDDRFWFEESGS
eukprot:m.95026 g.95026  ORF g.95026 m.95026 type:complete len:135 (+) comp51279_c0_seq5:139-543(+)